MNHDVSTAASAAAEIDDDYSDTISIDSCEEYLQFKSVRNPSTQLEESISFCWPGIYHHDQEEEVVVVDVDGCAAAVVADNGGEGGAESTSSLSSITKAKAIITPSESDNTNDCNEGRKLRKIILSTLLEEDDIAPLFDGARWAGTRLWRAAIRSIQYLAGHLPDTHVHPSIKLPRLMSTTTKVGRENSSNNSNGAISVLELGCGLGVPGMIFHLLGCNVVLTDQEDILSQLQKNVNCNFPTTSSVSEQTSFCEKEQASASTTTTTTATTTTNATTTIQALPLSWSRNDIRSLLEQVGRSDIGFDIVLNCDCVFEPLYGKSWHLLNETIDELLQVNPKCIVISSMERRNADGIDDFLEEMRGMANVGEVSKVWSEEGRTRIEIYQTTGR